MKLRIAALAAVLASACASIGMGGQVDLLANGLAGFTSSGGGYWSFANGEARASSGSAIGFLVSKEDFRDFELTAEIYVGDPHNSGIFFRCSDRASITATNCYEANVYDKRADQTGRTGAVPGFFTPPLAKVDAANKWNTMRIRAEGAHVTIWFNGVRTVDGDGPLGQRPHLPAMGRRRRPLPQCEGAKAGLVRPAWSAASR
jgi:hypothetical protein